MKNSAAKKQANENNRLAVEQSDKQYAYSKEQAEQQYQNDLKTMALQRQWDLEDRQFAIDNPTVIKGEVDYQQMVNSAEAAGINPLTALRNGGSAGFSASSQPSAPLSRTAPTKHAALRHAPGQQAANVSSPLAAGIGGFLDNFDPFADQKRELEYGLVQAQIANLNASTAGMVNRPASFNVPTYGAKSGEQRPSGVAAVLSGAPITPTVEAPTLTNPWEQAIVDPRVRDAAAAEERYGDVLGSAIGVYVGVRDLYHNYSAKVAKDIKAAVSAYSVKTSANTRRASGIRSGALSNSRDLHMPDWLR